MRVVAGGTLCAIIVVAGIVERERAVLKGG